MNDFDILALIHRILSTFGDDEFDDLFYDPNDGALMIEKDGKTYEITASGGEEDSDE